MLNDENPQIGALSPPIGLAAQQVACRFKHGFRGEK
jgi:hypothetical protein